MMNPTLVPFIIIIGILIWLLASFLFHKIGNGTDRMIDHVKKSLDLDTIDEDKQSKDKNKEEKEDEL